MKKPNYAEMKEMLAQRESESISQRELHEILLFGTTGWDSWGNDDILLVCLENIKYQKRRLNDSNNL